MMPGASRAACMTSSGRVEPRFFSATMPISSMRHSSPSAYFVLARSRTSSVASVISGPMPSPGSTRILMCSSQNDV
jgi:hypothetical protein